MKNEDNINDKLDKLIHLLEVSNIKQAHQDALIQELKGEISDLESTVFSLKAKFEGVESTIHYVNGSLDKFNVQHAKFQDAPPQPQPMVTLTVPMDKALSFLAPGMPMKTANGVVQAVDLLGEEAAKLLANPHDQTVLSKQEQHFASHGNKIMAIKECRSRTGLGLKEAKDLVEAWMQKNLGYTTTQNPNPPF